MVMYHSPLCLFMFCNSTHDSPLSSDGRAPVFQRLVLGSNPGCGIWDDCGGQVGQGVFPQFFDTYPGLFRQIHTTQFHRRRTIQTVHQYKLCVLCAASCPITSINANAPEYNVKKNSSSDLNFQICLQRYMTELVLVRCKTHQIQTPTMIF